MPEYTIPMLGQTMASFSSPVVSTSGDGGDFSTARTIAFCAARCTGVREYCDSVDVCTPRRRRGSPLIPRQVAPELTAARACSICTSLPEGEKVVSEKLYALSPLPAIALLLCVRRERVVLRCVAPCVANLPSTHHHNRYPRGSSVVVVASVVSPAARRVEMRPEVSDPSTTSRPTTRSRVGRSPPESSGGGRVAEAGGGGRRSTGIGAREITACS